jgi:hypothetical protein
MAGRGLAVGRSVGLAGVVGLAGEGEIVDCWLAVEAVGDDPLALPQAAAMAARRTTSASGRLTGDAASRRPG